MNLSKMVIAFSLMAFVSSTIVGKEWHCATEINER
jgi:hypothetical protein